MCRYIMETKNLKRTWESIMNDTVLFNINVLNNNDKKENEVENDITYEEKIFTYNVLCKNLPEFKREWKILLGLNF